MSTTKNDTSDIKQAAKHVDTKQIEKNLEDKQQPNTPEPLTKEQQTPFIDEEVRTDN